MIMRLKDLARPISAAVFASVLSTVPAVLAQDAGQAAPPMPSFGETLLSMMPMFAMVFFVFYFMVLKPQQTKLRQHEQLMSSLKKGDTVVTTGGIIGRVAGIESDYILIEADRDVRLRVQKNHVVSRYEKKPAEGAS